MTDVAPVDEHGVVFVGLPESGKTTYLALVFRAIVMELAGDLRLGSYADDRAYVNEIAETLAACEPAAHTEVEQHEQLSLSLDTSSKSFALRIPDLSGERWLHAIQDRAWSPDLDAHVASAQGFVVFIHAETFDRGVTIAEAEVGDSSIEDSATEPLPDFVDDSERTRATQVAIVDLLQLIASRRPGRPLRLSVIASAWDRLGDDELSPQCWLSDELPLLHQFLTSNESWIATTLWGVSAQGGEFDDPEKRAALLEQDVVERAVIKRCDGTLASVDDPLRWPLGLA